MTCAISAYAQGGDAPPVDEVIACVNTGVIMRSTYETAQKEQLEQMKNSGLKGEELEKKFNELKPKILDELIHTQLLAQRSTGEETNR